MRTHPIALSVVAAVLSVSCAKKPKEMRVSPAKQTLYGMKKSSMLSAEILDKEGKPIEGLPVEWTSSKPPVATVEKTGQIRSIGPGKTIVSAKYQTLAANASIEVVDIAVVNVAPGRMTLAGARGTTGTLVAEVKDSKSKVIETKPVWASSNPKVAKVDANGVVTAMSEGKAAVTAALGDFVSASDVTVTFRDVASFELAPLTLILRPGETQLIHATARDAQGNTVEDAAVTWIVSDPASATIYNGMVTGKASGTATVRAVCGLKSAEVSVLVN